MFGKSRDRSIAVKLAKPGRVSTDSSDTSNPPVS